MDFKEFEDKTVDEAIIAAMKAFNATFEELDIQIISEGSKGIFGIVGNKNAKILAKPSQDNQSAEKQESAAPAATQTSHVQNLDKASLDQVIVHAKDVLTDLLRLMHISAEIAVHENGKLEIEGDGSGLIIGKHGQTLDALQFILSRITNKNRQEPVYITIDTEGYRERHLKHLESLAIKMGQKVKRTGQSISLEKMNPYDRRIIHLALKNDNRINTKSLGDGIYKTIVIEPRKVSK
ncbi:MAG: Jag N-terminal domain-containing protein [Deltaproteobacteria bacterium]|nr:Jag N-terminal domain-containing protein [Deltaproteobacteria bacterium]